MALYEMDKSRFVRGIPGQNIGGKMENFGKATDPSLWQKVLDLYDQVLKTKAGTMKNDKGKLLLSLDKWYQQELSEAIQSRKEKYLTFEELTKLMKWKLTRGKFRPRLEQMVQSNSEEDVVTASKHAFGSLPDISVAISSLSKLKAVGPATASAILAAGAPDRVAFMADESMMALPGLSPVQYTAAFYAKYMEMVKELVKKLNKGNGQIWTPHKVELALWTYQVAKTLSPDLLTSLDSEMGASMKRKHSDSTVASSNKKKQKA